MNEPFALTQCKTISSAEFESLPVDRYVMEPKVDGWRMQIDVSPQGVRSWTRTNHDATGKMPWVEKELLQLAAGHHLRLDGEAVYIGEDGKPDYNFTARCLGSHTDVCVLKQREIGSLTYVAFDILMYEDVDIRFQPLATRKIQLKRSIEQTEHVLPIMGHMPSFERHTKNFEQYLEGSVLKDLNAPYAGKRHKSWLKWKEIETIDVQIVGYKEGQGKFEGLIGAIGFYDPEGKVYGYCSGMDDETRVFISNNREALMYKVIELKHFGKLVGGYRHPQFVRFRSDKV